MRKLFSHGLFVFAGVVVLPATVTHADQRAWDMREHRSTDPRFHLLKRFFKAKQCPAEGLTQDFLDAADRYKLDWRLLPSLSVIETGGGKVCKRNNMFGWNNGKAMFPSLTAGIHEVASALSRGHYQNKSLDRLLATYNPKAGYVESVKAVMTRISPSTAPAY